MSRPPMTIHDLQQHTRSLAANWPHTTPEQRVLYLMTEVGELANRAGIELEDAFARKIAANAQRDWQPRHGRQSR